MVYPFSVEYDDENERRGFDENEIAHLELLPELFVKAVYALSRRDKDGRHRYEIGRQTLIDMIDCRAIRYSKTKGRFVLTDLGVLLCTAIMEER